LPGLLPGGRAARSGRRKGQAVNETGNAKTEALGRILALGAGAALGLLLRALAADPGRI